MNCDFNNLILKNEVWISQIVNMQPNKQLVNGEHVYPTVKCDQIFH